MRILFTACPMYGHVNPVLPLVLAARAERLPASLDALPYERTVHLTPGTVFRSNRNVLHTAIAALSALPVNVVATDRLTELLTGGGKGLPRGGR